MITTLKHMLAEADNHGYAVIAPDFPDLFTVRSLLEFAEQTNTPLILSYATVFKPMRDVRKYADFIGIVRKEIESIDIPVVLHLDHATALDDIREAVNFGYSSVMMDASFEPYETNLELTCQAIAIARPHGVSVEAELGHVATNQDYVTHIEQKGLLTDVDLAVQFVQETQIDALAVAIGTVHGPYKGEPNLDFERLRLLDQRIDIPLVLHGSSGLGEENIQRSVSMGIRKINVYSDLIRSMLAAAVGELSRQTSDPIKVRLAQEAAVRRVIESYAQPAGSFAAWRTRTT